MGRYPLTLAAVAMTLSVQGHEVQAANDVEILLSGGEVGLSFRYRFEHVDDDAFGERARASTVRSRLALRSGRVANLSFFVEVDDVREILLDDFDSGAGNTPGRGRFPVVADPESTEVNQAYLDVEPAAGALLRIGRQRINLDDERFVGGVGWRQNEQTYDAASVSIEGGRGHVFYAVVENVNRIFGEDVPAGDHRQDATHLLNLGTGLGAGAAVVAYHYAIDNRDAPALSTRTTGLRLSGARSLTRLDIGYLAEYAHQADAAAGPVNYDADYWHLRGRAERNGWAFSAGWEVLTGDADRPGRAFRTPLATLHAFNGWADKFLETPDAGLDDRYLALATAPGSWTFELRGHRFRAENANGDYGSEIDLRLGRRLGRHLQVDVFAASFDGRGDFRDVSKLWVMLTAAL